MPALPMTLGRVRGLGLERTIVKSRMPLMGEASMFWRYFFVWPFWVCGGHDLGFGEHPSSEKFMTGEGWSLYQYFITSSSLNISNMSSRSPSCAARR